jgi:hypothetical protein
MTDKTRARPVLRLAAFFFLAPLLLFAASAPAAGGGQRFSLTLAAGCFSPGQGSLREIYARPAWPLELQLGWEWKRNLALFAAARYQNAAGSTVLLQARETGLSYALRLEMLTLRLGLNWLLGTRRFIPLLGAGVNWTSFREKWRDLPIEAQASKMGVFVQTGGRYLLGGRWRALVQLEYSSLAAGSGMRGKVNLGGLSLMLGLGCGIF